MGAPSTDPPPTARGRELPARTEDRDRSTDLHRAHPVPAQRPGHHRRAGATRRQRLVDHQRFDSHTSKAGGEHPWPYRAPSNYGCWESLSCYHGVAGAFRALAAIPPAQRSTDVQARLDEAIDYLRPRRLYKKRHTDQPLFRHMKQPFLVGDYRFDLLDMLDGIADADPELVHEDWVAEAVDDMRDLATDGRVVLAKNYGRKLIDPIPLEPVGQPSRFLTYQWLRTQRLLGLA